MKLYLYQDRKGEHRWRAVSRNGRILADCGEGYTSHAMLMKGFKALKKALYTEDFTEIYAAPPTRFKLQRRK